LVAGRAPTKNWVLEFLRTLDLIERGAGDEALMALENAPKTAAFAQLSARAHGCVSHMPSGFARDRQIQQWAKARKIAPIRSEFRLAQLYRRAAQPQRALSLLRGLRTKMTIGRDFHDEWIKVLDHLGRRRVLRRYIARHGTRTCDHLELRTRLLRHRKPTTLAKTLARCGKAAQAVDLLLQYYRPKDALKLVANTPLPPDEAAYLKARALLSLGKGEQARTALESVTSRSAVRLRLDLDLAAGNTQAFNGQVREWVSRNVTHPTALGLMSAKVEWSPVGSLYTDTEQAIEAHQNAHSGFRTTRVLDHSILLYDQDGKSLRRVHEILAVGSRSAAERFGELGLPEDAVPIAVYTRKADGRIRFAESMPEKDSLSLPDLAPGDFIVALYIEPNRDPGMADARFLSQRTYFGDFEIGIGHQRLDAFPPKDAIIVIESLFDAPKVQRIAVDGRAGIRFARRDIQPITDEPRGPIPEAVIPSIRFGSAVSFRDEIWRFRDTYLSQSAITPQFERWVRRVADSAGEADVVE